MKRSAWIHVFLLSFLLLSACDLLNNGETAVDTIITAPDTAATPAVTAVAVQPDSAIPITTTQETPHLTVWLPSEIALSTEESATVLADQIFAFSRTHADLTINVEQKPVSGQGGILKYLRTGQNVAPKILPDVIALPFSQLPAAAEEGLIVPLDDLVDPAVLDAFFSTAVSQVQPADQLLGLPFMLTNLPHLTYNSSMITETISLTWSEFISDTNGSFLFPASGTDGAMLTLHLYLAAGGRVADETGRAALQAEPLAKALDQILAGRNTGFISPESNSLMASDVARQALTTGTASIIYGLTDKTLSGLESEIPLGFAPLPGEDGSLPALVDGWAWAVTSSNPAARATAIELIATLTNGSELGLWSVAANRLPAREDAFAAWPTDAYTTFVQQELAHSQPLPQAVTNEMLMVLENAIFKVLTGELSPADAALAAAAALNS